MRVRFTRRVLEHLSGSQAATDSTQPDYALFRKVLDAPTRKDGSATLELSDEERAELLIYVEVFEIGASQNIYPGETDGLADLNAARAAVRALSAVTR
jgi:hypothetical protein